MRVLAVALLFALWSYPVTAGGTSSSAQISEFVRVSDSVTTFSVRFNEPFDGLSKATMERCPEISVWAEYNPGWWFWAAGWSKAGLVTEQTHADALAALEKAATTKESIRFGTAGTGLHERATECDFETRGLAVFAEDKGTWAVYAFYNSN